MALISRLPSGGGSKVKFETGSITGSSSTLTKTITFGFIPNYVCLMLPNYSGELKTPCIVYRRTGTNKWSISQYSDAIHNYYDGSGGSDMAAITTINDSKMTVTIYGYSQEFIWIAWQ